MTKTNACIQSAHVYWVYGNAPETILGAGIQGQKDLDQFKVSRELHEGIAVKLGVGSVVAFLPATREVWVLIPGQCSVLIFGLPRWHSGKETSANADTREAGLIPGWGRSPEEGNGNLLRFFCLENPRVQSMESW